MKTLIQITLLIFLSAFVSCSNEPSFTRTPQSVSETTFYETVLVRNIPQNSVKWQKAMIAYVDSTSGGFKYLNPLPDLFNQNTVKWQKPMITYVDSTGGGFEYLKSLPDLESYRVSFHKSTIRSRAYYLKAFEDRPRYRDSEIPSFIGKTDLGYISFYRDKRNKDNWSISMHLPNGEFDEMGLAFYDSYLIEANHEPNYYKKRLEDDDEVMVFYNQLKKLQ